MAHTAITKAIEQIKADSEYRHIHYQSACDKAIKILTDLLPYERETIEAAHIDGQKLIVDCVKECLPKINLSTTYDEISKALIEGDQKTQDYFTKTYQNGNEL